MSSEDNHCGAEGDVVRRASRVFGGGGAFVLNGTIDSSICRYKVIKTLPCEAAWFDVTWNSCSYVIIKCADAQ